jgi:hypothetical protein
VVWSGVAPAAGPEHIEDWAGTRGHGRDPSEASCESVPPVWVEQRSVGRIDSASHAHATELVAPAIERFVP